MRYYIDSIDITTQNRIFVRLHITLKSIKQKEKQASFLPEMRSSRVTGET